MINEELYKSDTKKEKNFQIYLLRNTIQNIKE